ncbi:MAG: transglutaminase family protein, partial [Caulobacterales bacterium]|nr:transglutaminase family protein [Caulobacterales bacterium]
MTIEVALNHRTTYRYDRLVNLGPQTVRLRPAPHCRTPILSYSQTVSPAEHFINWQQDPFGNYLARLVFPERTEEFEVVVDLVARLDAINPFDFFLEESAFNVPFAYPPDLAKDLSPYLEIGEGGPRVEAFVASVPLHERRTVDFLVDLNRRVQEAVQYVIRMEPGVQAPEDTLSLARGSCRDSAWLMVEVLRRLGYAARFVSGYLIQLTADEKAIDGPAGPESDFTDLHAWAEVYAPGAGWIGLDPTSGLFAGEGHIPLAATPNPRSAAPITGGLDECEVSFDFGMSVRRVHETPRVSKPYTNDQWRAIDTAGRAIDAKLAAGDVRLTMGGEPTFVAADDPDAEEWNIDAVGPTKRRYADDLIRRLRRRFAPGGLLHYGQGKWYPGESLPRWAFALYWRGDGLPLWEDDALIAPEAPGGAADAPAAERFIRQLAQTLQVEPAFAQPAYEDTAEFLLKEGALAPDLDPTDNRLEDPEERARMARVFERGLTTPAAFILPIQLAQSRAAGDRRRFAWRSESWRTRRNALFLVPGDSPAGFRLPLRSLRHVAESDQLVIHPLDPFAARGVLPS